MEGARIRINPNPALEDADPVSVDVEALYRRYGPMVLRRCRRLLVDEEEAVEAAQEVFVNLVVHQQRLEPRGASSLLYRMATNVCLNHIRSRSRRPESPDSDLLQRIAAATRDEQATSARNLLQLLFGTQPPDTATIAVLHLHDGLTLEEVADTVGLSVSGVRKRLRKLRATLRELADLD